jgi:biopolymer transport protein ExbD
MRGRFRKRKQRRTEISQELELMPMLNVFISIIPLLLLSAAFVQLAVIPTMLPAATAPPAASTDEASLALTIVIREDAYVVEANGATSGTIARPADGAHDAPAATAARAQLGSALAAIATAHPEHRSVRIVAIGTTRYEDIIDVMDVSRGAGLPEAALADAAPGGAS